MSGGLSERTKEEGVTVSTDPAPTTVGGSGSSPPTVTPADSSPARIWRRIYLVAALTIGIASALIRPPMSGPDESKHFTRIVTLGHGLVIPATTDSMATKYRVDSCEKSVLALLYLSYLDPAYAQKTSFGKYFSDSNCPPALSAKATVGSSRSPPADINPPLVYVPAMVGYRLGRSISGILRGLIAARLLQMLVAVGLTWWALRILPRGHALFATVALVPAIVQVNGTINADPVSNAVALVWLALLLRTIDETTAAKAPPDRRWVLLLAFAGLAVALTKPSLVPILFVVLAIPRCREPVLRHAARLAVMLGPALVAAALWDVAVVSKMHVVAPGGADSYLSAAFVRGHPLAFAGAAFRGLTDPTALHYTLDRLVYFWLLPRGSALPRFMTVAAIGGVLAIALAWWGSRGNGPPTLAYSWYRVLVVTGAIVMALIVMQYGLALVFEKPGAHEITGIQARYLMPLIPLAYLATRPRAGPPTRVMRNVSMVALGLVLVINAWALTETYTVFYG